MAKAACTSYGRLGVSVPHRIGDETGARNGPTIPRQRNPLSANRSAV